MLTVPATPSAPLDITGKFPELARWARTAVRLHPRLGKPDVRESSLGGPLLWPATEAWPTCTAPHEPPERADHPPCPLAGVLQVYARDVPELPFPDGSDMLQVLWCPNTHGAPWWGPWPQAFWRREVDVTDVLWDPPAPLFDEPYADLNASRYVPEPCVLHPERVTEYPRYYDLPGGGLRERVQAWDYKWSGDDDRLYTLALSTAPGIKALGYPHWYQGPAWPFCQCGRRMIHLVTFASQEDRGHYRWVPAEDDGTRLRHGDPAHGLVIGDSGDMYLFTCAACTPRPLAGSAQFG